MVKHDILVANFQQRSMLHLHCITALVGMVHVWEVKVSRRLYKVKVLYSACYTLYGVIEIVESAAHHKLHHSLGNNALVFVILLNKLNVWLQGNRALTTIAQYFEVNNCSIDKSEHGTKYYFYDISSAFGPLFDPSSSLGEILSIPLSGSTTYILVNHGNISFDKKGTDGKEEWNKLQLLFGICVSCCYKI
ncbi:hypothetical protein H5410_024383 [Solanum commersonii]|uniref:Uncharacterized protein n=1 Tax=Solanum commersonii TaxID=4109 RepID=A0A9J5ZLW1_SOLCO|nr:hypothetical protein H5410_024383 [Solanum commersonii]